MFAHNEAIKEVERVKSIQMRLSTRFLYLSIIKNVLPRFGKRDVAGFAELTYMRYMVKKKVINFPSLIIRHMAHVINTRKHELRYAELLTIIFKAFDVPFPEQDEKWLGIGEIRRRDEMVDETEEDSTTKEGTDSREESTPVSSKGESTDSEDTYFDVVDDGVDNFEDDHDDSNEVRNTQEGSSQKKFGQRTNAGGIDPFTMAIDFQLLHLQRQLQQDMQENARLQELLKQYQSSPLAPSPDP
ncbi:hypothetical protein Dimus_013266 [Dionaea muscipula]